jgi:hypothetical protein
MSTITGPTPFQTQGALMIQATSKQAIDQAKEDFMTFVNSTEFKHTFCSISDLKDNLVKIYNNAGHDPRLAFSFSHILIGGIILEAEEAGFLNATVADVYFADDVNQVSLTDEISQAIINYAELKESPARSE